MGQRAQQKIPARFANKNILCFSANDCCVKNKQPEVTKSHDNVVGSRVVSVSVFKPSLFTWHLIMRMSGCA